MVASRTDPRSADSTGMTLERNRRRIPRLGALLVAALLVVGAGQGAATASTILTVKRHGSCSQSSTWSLKLHVATTTSLAVTFEVSNAPAGRQWNVFVSDRGGTVVVAKRTTSSSGTFSVVRQIKNLAGLDTITVGANTASTGELCSAKATI
jgi:hypothetical protein